MARGPEADALRLRRALRDLVALSAVPAAWVGREPNAIAAGLADVLVNSLYLGFAFVRLCDPNGEPAVEITRGDAWPGFPEWLQNHLVVNQRLSRREIVRDIENGAQADRGIVVPVGINAEGGLVAAACDRADFPSEIDQLLLSVAANHAATAFRTARLIDGHRRAEEALRQSEHQLRRARDELETKVAERTAELRRSETYLAEAQRLSRTGSFGWNIASGNIYWSEETFRIFECDRLAQPTVDLVLQRTHPLDRAGVQQTIDRATQDRTDLDFEHRLLMPDGRIKNVRIVGHPVFDKSGDFVEFAGTVMDVTEHRRAEEERQALAHANRITTVGQLTASIAHEINQPIAAVISNAQAASRWLDMQPPNPMEVRESLGRIVKDGKRASEVISRIRALVRKAPARKEPLDINDTIREVIALTYSQLRNNGTSLRTQLAHGLPVVAGDRVQLQQVMVNLVINAIEAMSGIRDGMRELTIVSAETPSNHVFIEVQDTGPGFGPANLDRLFQSFYTTKPDGMGMGLAISRSIVEAHGGRMSAAPNGPRGAIFRVTVPVERTEPGSSE
jgi:C4-dicarboxylate-specific signal transduction histidine kinase